MNLPKEAIAEFKEIYERKHGVCLEDQEAELKASELLQLISLSQGYQLDYDQ